MTADSERPQDAGRPHRRKGAPSAATVALLDTYQSRMRTALAAVLDVVEPGPTAGLVGDHVNRPAITDRMRYWDLAIKLGRELGSAIDPPELAADDDAGGVPGRRRGRVDYGGA